MLGNDLTGTLLAFVDDAPNLFIDDPRGRIGDVLALRNRVPEEDLFLILAIGQSPQLLAEAPFGHHPARDIRRLLQILGGARRHFLGPEDDLFGNATAEKARDARFELLARHAVFVALGHEPSQTEGAAAR